jgi:hypothetical protein
VSGAYLATDDDDTPRALYRVEGGRTLRWRHFDWEALEGGARDRVLRQVYLGPEDLSPLPEAEVPLALEALRWREQRRLRAWRFRLEVPGGLELLEARLAPLGRRWVRLDSDSRADTLGSALDPHAHLHFESTGVGFLARVAAADATPEGAEAHLARAARQVLEEVLPALGATGVEPVAAGEAPVSLGSALAAAVDRLLALGDSSPGAVGAATGVTLRRVPSGAGLGLAAPGEEEVEDFAAQLPAGPFDGLALQRQTGAPAARLALRVRRGLRVFRGDLRPARYGPERRAFTGGQGALEGSRWRVHAVGGLEVRFAFEPVTKALQLVVLEGAWPATPPPPRTAPG